MNRFSLITVSAYAALCLSLFLPSRPNEMTSSLGEAVKVWEPSIAIHFQILFAPLVEISNYCTALHTTEEMYVDQLRSEMYSNILYWLPVTLTGWLFVAYPARKFIRNNFWKRHLQHIAIAIAAVGSCILIHHLLREATVYTGYFHLGPGGYLLIAAYVLFVIHISGDKPQGLNDGRIHATN